MKDFPKPEKLKGKNAILRISIRSNPIRSSYRLRWQ